MYDRPDSLFAGTSSYDFSRSAIQKALTELRQFDENTILSFSKEDLIDKILASNQVFVPTLQPDDTTIEEREIAQEVNSYTYDVFLDRGHGRHTIQRHIVTFHVPFSGDAHIFNIAPSQRSIPGPSAKIVGQELLIALTTNGRTPEQLKSDYEKILTSINVHLNRLRHELQNIPQQIQPPASQYIEQRKPELLTSKSLVASLGFPMKRRPDAQPTYRTPDIRRKLTPLNLPASPPFKPEPTLEEAEYTHILNVMENMTKVMELSPQTFYGMGEEDIRQHFLVQLRHL
ncbi:hypothetical protein [Acidocella facilis]|uniref:hypothetical protein n=1 Tax=Acidocella facilis TaxID=525 RepID=UPI0012DF1989|nr:hypothetical protein [Acidocella facilis]